MQSTAAFSPTTGPSRRPGRRPPRALVVRALLLALVVLAAAACGARESTGGQAEGGGACDRAADYPAGPVELIVPWAAGGGTDSVARFIGSQLADRLGSQVNVVNRTGGSGAVGHTAIAGAQPDGQTLGMATVEAAMMHWQGLTEFTVEDLTAVAQVNIDPAGVTVRADAPWNSIEDLLADAKARPGELTGSGTGVGGIWDLARAGMLQAAGLPPDAIRWVPSEGAAPALQELAAGGVDVSFASLAENRSLIEEGRVKALAIMGEERHPNFPDVPTLTEQGVDYSVGAWRGIAGPTGLPEDVVAELGCHLEEIVDSGGYEEFMGKTGFGILYRGPEDFARFMREDDAAKGELMRAAGLVG